MQIGIIGAGRFGKYLAYQIKKDRSHIVRLADAYPEVQGTQLLEHVMKYSELLILAPPISKFSECVNIIQPMLQSKQMLMDVCSVKMHPYQVIQDVLPDMFRRYIGTHPLFGPQSAPHSCAGQRVVICNHEASDLDVLIAVQDLLQTTLGLIPIHCSAETHDEEMARTQVINHFLGRAAGKVNIQRSPMATATHERFMDIVEIVNNNSYELFEDMNRFNPYASFYRDEFLENLRRIHTELGQ